MICFLPVSEAGPVTHTGLGFRPSFQLGSSSTSGKEEELAADHRDSRFERFLHTFLKGKAFRNLEKLGACDHRT